MPSTHAEPGLGQPSEVSSSHARVIAISVPYTGGIVGLFTDSRRQLQDTIQSMLDRGWSLDAVFGVKKGLFFSLLQTLCLLVTFCLWCPERGETLVFRRSSFGPAANAAPPERLPGTAPLANAAPARRAAYSKVAIGTAAGALLLVVLSIVALAAIALITREDLLVRGVGPAPDEPLVAPPTAGPTPTGGPAPGQLPSGPTAVAGGGVCPEGMLRIPRGTFWMGSPEGVGDDDEHPAHEVTIADYCLDRIEVAVSAYLECVRAGSCEAPPGAVDEQRRYCNGSRQDRLDHPVNCVDWSMASRYCEWRGGRLPTEAEWEYAARGATGRAYAWGDAPPDAARANVCEAACVMLGAQEGRTRRPMHAGDDAWGATAPVGSFPQGASPFGALDMTGNVWEWVADWYAPYAPEPQVDPRGPDWGERRVGRGGGWWEGSVSDVRAAERWGGLPAARMGNLGFRCARSG